MRRKPGTLLPLEVEILDTVADLERSGTGEIHGFGLARQLRERTGARELTGHGTLYKALGRMEEAGLLSSRWEDPEVASVEGRPRRRLYALTGEGQRVAAKLAAPGSSATFRLASEQP